MKRNHEVAFAVKYKSTLNQIHAIYMECGKIVKKISKLVWPPQIDQALSSSQMEQNVEVPARNVLGYSAT